MEVQEILHQMAVEVEVVAELVVPPVDKVVLDIHLVL